VYSERKVAERIALAEWEFKFSPEYHSVDEVDDFEQYLKATGKYIYNSQGFPESTQNLSASDRQWMLNEQVLCLCDAAYWLTRYAYLKNEEGTVQRFRFRVPQRIYFDIICDLEDREAAIEILALKARQLGISIFTELLITHRTTFSYGVTAVAGSADQAKTAVMSEMMFMAYDQMPIWLRPQYTSRVESQRGKMLFGHMATGVTLQHGSQKFGIATGSTPTIYHLSEVALYGDAAVKLIDEGLWKAVHASPKVFGVLESTGRGNTGWWAETWYYSKDNWPSARMYPMFLPWYCGTDIYPMPTDMRTHPIPSGWHPDRDTKTHAAKAQLYVESTPLLKRHLLEEQKRRGVYQSDHWQMPIEQQWYWEWNHREAKTKGTESSFLQEMAGDDTEALQRSVESVFGNDTILEIDTARKKSYECYAISGQSIEAAHDPPTECIDYDRERIPVLYRSQRGGAHRWEFIPLKFRSPLRESHVEDATGILFVWHPPKLGVNYSIGVDTSEGKGIDSTSINVWSIGATGQPDEQCAEFASPYVNHVEAFAFVLAIAAWYGAPMLQSYSDGRSRWKEPYVSVEQVAAVGDTCQLQMAKMGYTNFHRMTRYDYSMGKINKMKSSKAGHRGWFTHGWSRPILVTTFVHFVQNGWAKVNSPWLIGEMKEFEVHYTAAGKEKLEHAEDEHDDRIFSSAMAVFCPQDTKSIVERSKRRSIEGSAFPPLDLTPYNGLTINPDSMLYSKPMSLNDILYLDRDLRGLSR
jgi:hypothetical protein